MSKNIYEYIRETFGIDVVGYTFKRDYIVNPLVRLKTKGNPKELPYKEDVEYLYLTLNLNIKDLQIIFASSEDLIRKSFEVYKIKKSKKMIIEHTNKTKLERYGSSSYNNRDKAKQTCLEKYGVDNVSSLSVVKQKKIDTCLTNYGVEHPMQSKEVMNKSFDKCIEVYGFHRASKTEEVKEKIFKTNIERYGNKCSLNNSLVKDKAEQTFAKNKSHSASFEEKELIQMIIDKGYTVETHYSKDLRYPFRCDVYIKELDMFIEYQGSWVHGPQKYDCHEPFDNKNPKHLKAKCLMEEYNSEYYHNAIETWTVTDVNKRETARKNKINYKEFFTYDSMKDWINELKGVD